MSVPDVAATLLSPVAWRAPFAPTAAVLALTAVFLSAVALPLATYTTALALFGLAHVGSELRYVDYRFGGRIRGGLAVWILLPLAAAVMVRLAGMAGALPATVGAGLELLLGAVMAVAAVTAMRQRRLAGACVAAGLVAGALVAPFQTLLLLAIAHNLTPLAFLADALAGAQRRRMLAAMSVPFVLLPLLIASRLPQDLLSRIGLVDPEAMFLDGGALTANMAIYVPMSVIDTSWALPMFSASVFAQCMHYAAVILLLPRLIEPGRARPIAPWPNARRFALYLAAAALMLAVGFVIDFKVARQFYALAALVHAWVEIPILLLALDRGRGDRVTPG